jgi:hypothetical protein
LELGLDNYYIWSSGSYEIETPQGWDVGIWYVWELGYQLFCCSVVGIWVVFEAMQFVVDLMHTYLYLQFFFNMRYQD